MSSPAAVNRYAHLFEGLTPRRVLLVTFLCVWAAAAIVWFFANTYLDLLVSALCVGYTSMILFTAATNVRGQRLPRWRSRSPRSSWGPSSARCWPAW